MSSHVAPLTRKMDLEKTQNSKCTSRVRAIVIAGEKEKVGARVCVVCYGIKTHEEERGKGNFCTRDRFSADGFRTRATRVIRWRVLGVLAAKGETEGRRAGRPGDFRMRGKRCVWVVGRCVSKGRGPEGRCTLPHS